MCVYTRHVCVGAQKAEEGVGFTGAGIIGSHELHNLRTLLTTELPLKTPFVIFFFKSRTESLIVHTNTRLLMLPKMQAATYHNTKGLY